MHRPHEEVISQGESFEAALTQVFVGSLLSESRKRPFLVLSREVTTQEQSLTRR